MRTIIAGSRTIDEYALVEQAVKESGFTITTVISGCARGVDSLGELWAELNHIPVERHPAEWKRDGEKLAGFMRNERMADVAEALIAVTNGSPGTKHMIVTARRRGLKVFVKSNQRVLALEEFD